MPTTSITKIKTNQNNLYLRVAKGHFATSSSHSNYYIDVAAQKSRLSEAKAVAKAAYSNKKPYGPEIHGGGALGYYYHYHVYDHRKNGHVFFLFW